MFKFFKFFGVLKKTRKSKDDRINDFLRDLRSVHGHHGQWLTPKELQVLSKPRVCSMHWLRNCVDAYKSRFKKG